MAATTDAMTEQLQADQAAAGEAQANLVATTQDFSPPQQTQGNFTEDQPHDHFNELVGYAPLLMALGAVGGRLGRNHGIAMLASTNAMMKGLSQGSAEQYADARQQYETKYAQWKDQSRTWFDSYKAYMTAYKGRIDAQARAVQGANAAVGIDQKNLKVSQNQVDQTKLIAAKVDNLHSEITNRDRKTTVDEIKARTQQERVRISQQEADIKLEDLKNKTKTADANSLMATSRSLKSEADSILKQYPTSAGKRPPDIDIKLKAIRDQMDLVNERLEDHKTADYQKNKGTYDDARAAIASGADPAAVKKQAASMGLDPDKI